MIVRFFFTSLVTFNVKFNNKGKRRYDDALHTTYNGLNWGSLARLRGVFIQLH